MISRCFVLLLAVALTGCCASGVGCNALTPGAPVVWDGLGPAAVENIIVDSTATGSAVAEHKKSRRAAARVDTKSQNGDQFEQQQAADQDADAKLNKQLKICRDC
jgi:hypothetical protein